MNANIYIGIIELAAALGALIIIHEFGHFVVSRLFKIEVEEFGIGFPPRMLTLFKAAGTKFTLNWIPLGGFVRPKGENDPEVLGGLAAASPWVRLAVLLAGPLSNLLVGVIIYAVIFRQIGMPISNQVEILEVAPNSPAQQAGLRAGDLVVQVNDQKIDSVQSMQNVIFDNLGKQTTIIYQRDGKTGNVSLIPRQTPPEGEGAIGIVMSNPTQSISLLAAIPIGAKAVYEHSITILTLPVKMLEGQTSPSDGRFLGFKGMFDVYQAVRQSEPTPSVPQDVNILGFFAAITISLGILNLLPVPALDGGRIFFLLPEIVLRRRIPPEYENVINLIGFAILLVLLLYINLQDFVNPIQFPK
jgi:regulator of sigma E protease